MDEQSIPQDVPQPDATPVEPAEAPVEQDQQASTNEQPVAAEAPTEAPAVEATAVEEDEEVEYPQYQLPDVPQLDFNNLPTGEDNLVDPNVLAQTINHQMATIEQRATLKAQAAYQEQRAEERAWEKAYEKYPELKTNKEVRDLVHRARLGEVADLLSKTNDPHAVKLPTPAQIADKFFKFSTAQKQEGMKQATANVTVQSSAYVETAAKATDDSSDALAQARANINNPDPVVRQQARNAILQSHVFGS